MASTEWLNQRPPRRILTSRLELRCYAADDASAAVQAVTESLEHLRPWMPWASQPPTLAGQWEVVASFEREFETGPSFVYGIFDRPGGRMVGGCGLHARRGPAVLEIGYWIRADSVGRGYATAASRALTDAAFSMPEVRRVEIRCDEANLASAAVPRKLGFTLERIAAEQVTAPGESGQEMLWAMDRTRWFAPEAL